MKCQEAIELIPLYATGALEKPELEGLLAHLASGCPGCQGAAAEAVATMAQLALSLPPEAPDAGIRGRLMDRVRISSSGSINRPSESRWRIYAASALLSGLAAVLGVLITYSTMSGKMHRMNQKLTIENSKIQQLNNTAKFTDLMIKMLKSRRLVMVSLEGSSQQKQAMGRIFWDKSQHMWQFCGIDMKPLSSQKTYELWFISAAKKKIPGGTFNVNQSGFGMLTTAVPKDVGPLEFAAVTTEPAGGVLHPTGKVQLIGKLD